MSYECCSFCETLRPARPGWGGKASKCPVCKQDLWIASDGATYRIGDAAGSSGKWCLGVWLSAAVVVAVIACVAGFVSRGEVIPIPQRVESPTVGWGDLYRETPAPMLGPTVQAKTGRGNAARAKLLPIALVKTGSDTVPEPVAKDAGRPGAYWRSSMIAADVLEAQLCKVPEADLDPEYLKRTKQQIAKQAQDIVDATKDDQDAFVRKLMVDRPDLAGLPFLLGKDCKLLAQESKLLAARSLEIRSEIGGAARKYPARRLRTPDDSLPSEMMASSFWARAGDHAWSGPDGIAALHQILQPESRNVRLNLVCFYKQIKGTKATEALVNRVVFDADFEIRRTAIKHLHERPKNEYRVPLLSALRYPWQPTVRHALDAIVALELTEVVPDLVALLDEPHPGSPITVKTDDGRQKKVVRELVRINHHRNCMLCHSPANVDRREFGKFPIGPVPVPSQPLPPRASPEYYGPDTRSGAALVRADITYLRQDFSLLQKVAEPGKWSEMQRFDFLVRTREMSVKDVGQAPTTKSIAAYKQTIGEALSALTGLTAAPTAQAWRTVLAGAEPRVQARAKR